MFEAQLRLRAPTRMEIPIFKEQTDHPGAFRDNRNATRKTEVNAHAFALAKSKGSEIIEAPLSNATVQIQDSSKD